MLVLPRTAEGGRVENAVDRTFRLFRYFDAHDQFLFAFDEQGETAWGYRAHVGLLDLFLHEDDRGDTLLECYYDGTFYTDDAINGTPQALSMRLSRLVDLYTAGGMQNSAPVADYGALVAGIRAAGEADQSLNNINMTIGVEGHYSQALPNLRFPMPSASLTFEWVEPLESQLHDGLSLDHPGHGRARGQVAWNADLGRLLFRQRTFPLRCEIAMRYYHCFNQPETIKARGLDEEMSFDASLTWVTPPLLYGIGGRITLGTTGGRTPPAAGEGRLYFVGFEAAYHSQGR